MSNYFTNEAASEIAAAFRALPAAGSKASMIAPQRTRMDGTGLSNGVVGKGHPPRGIPPL